MMTNATSSSKLSTDDETPSSGVPTSRLNRLDECLGGRRPREAGGWAGDCHRSRFLNLTGQAHGFREARTALNYRWPGRQEDGVVSKLRPVASCSGKRRQCSGEALDASWPAGRRNPLQPPLLVVGTEGRRTCDRGLDYSLPKEWLRGSARHIRRQPRCPESTDESYMARPGTMQSIFSSGQATANGEHLQMGDLEKTTEAGAR